MESRHLFLCIAYFQVTNSQYYTVPASSYASCYYYPPSSAPTYTPTIWFQPRSTIPLQPQTSKRNVGSTAKPSVKCFPRTASAYFLSTPLFPETNKRNVVEKKVENNNCSPYSCPLCNNFADVLPNSKIAPPPAIESPVLPALIEKVNISRPKKNMTMDSTILLPKTSFSDINYERNEASKKLRFDQELLEGFLTGLGIAM